VGGREWWVGGSGGWEGVVGGMFEVITSNKIH